LNGIWFFRGPSCGYQPVKLETCARGYGFGESDDLVKEAENTMAPVLLERYGAAAANMPAAARRAPPSTVARHRRKPHAESK